MDLPHFLKLLVKNYETFCFCLTEVDRSQCLLFAALEVDAGHRRTIGVHKSGGVEGGDTVEGHKDGGAGDLGFGLNREMEVFEGRHHKLLLLLSLLIISKHLLKSEL